MNFTYEKLSKLNETERANITCAYASPDDLYWKTKECDTDYDLKKNVVVCSCKHMSYYTIINNQFDEIAY